jgi:ferrous iron transport protein B
MGGAATGSQTRPPSAGSSAPVHIGTDPRADDHDPALPPRIALLGNPNTGKTTLFNRLCGLRHKTSNFPGTTLEARLGRLRLDGQPVAGGPRSDCCGQDDAAPVTAHEPGARRDSVAGADLELIDLPGIYSLELDSGDSDICRRVLLGEAAPRGDRAAPPDGLCVVLDAASLGRNLMMAGEALRRRLPTVIAVNMIDLARRQGLSIDGPKLAELLGCRVVLISARTGEGLTTLRAALADLRIPTRTAPGGVGEAGAAAVRRWADEIYAQVGDLSDPAGGAPWDALTDRLDRVFTHPVGGILSFAIIMAALFYTLFVLAKYPMGWIEWIFNQLGSLITTVMPDGVLQDLLANGVVAGISGTVVFLPQICLLFFLISLLEDTGYLARAAFVMDRALRPFGLPGHSFVPLLSSHACALPGIMATRAIPDPRERLATILVAPFMTCSARLPVYVLVTTILFGDRPGMAALAFVGCYALGILAGVLSALLARRTILRGKSRPMCLELPTYKLPSVRTALITTWDRGWVFVKKAGTNIMMICIVLWWLGSYPHVQPPQQAVQLREQAQQLREHRAVIEAPNGSVEPVSQDLAASIDAEAQRLEAANAKSHSFMGRAGKAVEPVFRPLGYDWRLTIGVLTSFAAREVFVSTMAVVLAGEDTTDVAEAGVFHQIKSATRDDGVTPVFSAATCWSLLVFFVLAMQCLPTLAVTAKESGHVKWALLQLGWMSAVAYGAAALVYRLAS